VWLFSFFLNYSSAWNGDLLGRTENGFSGRAQSCFFVNG